MAIDRGLELAIKRAGKWWRIYVVQESERFGRYGVVLRDDAGKIMNFPEETIAREFVLVPHPLRAWAEHVAEVLLFQLEANARVLATETARSSGQLPIETTGFRS